MDIAGLSMSLSQIKTQNDVGMAVLDKTLDMNDSMGASLINMMDRSMMEQSVNPNVGSRFDMTV